MPGPATVLITGASSGIGYELAKLFARDGFQLILVARDHQALATIAHELSAKTPAPITILPADFSRPIAPSTLVDELREHGLQVDVLVNNAGFGVYGLFASTDLSAELDMIRVNATALTQLTKLLLPGMLERHRGKILNVASTAAFQPGPLMAVYYATKAYVLSFSEALANELRGSGVTVTALCPGPTATAFQQRAGAEQSRLFNGGMMDAARVARAGYDGMRRGRTVVIPGLRNRLLAFSIRLAPRTLVTRVVRWIQEQRNTGGQ